MRSLVSGLCVCTNMDVFEVLVHTCLYVYLCMCTYICVQGWEVAEEERQRDSTSPPSLSSSGKLTGTTEDVIVALNILGLPVLEWKFFSLHTLKKAESPLDSSALSCIH